MESHEGKRLAASLAERVRAGAGAAQVAEAVVSAWTEIDAALSPILGHKGFAALYKRTLHLSVATRPWLAPLREGSPAEPDLAGLQVVIMQQGSDEAALGAAALLQTFHDLLVTLIGQSLSARLLDNVWANHSNDPATQDTSP